MNTTQLVILAASFTWWGMVLAISGLETPLKFRAPGVTVALGLGIGRLVFAWLNACELLLLVLISVSAARSGSTQVSVGVVIGLWALLGTQVAVLRPVLHRRTTQVLAGAQVRRSSAHLGYIVLEAVKIVLLPALGVLSVGWPHP